MNKNNKKNRVVYGVSYFNHKKWTQPSSKSIFSKTAVMRLSGEPRTANIYRHLASFTELAAWDRKQKARIVQIPA